MGRVRGVHRPGRLLALASAFAVLVGCAGPGPSTTATGAPTTSAIALPTALQPTRSPVPSAPPASESAPPAASPTTEPPAATAEPTPRATPKPTPKATPKPTTRPSWDIQVSIPATHARDALGLAMTITITGTFAVNIHYDPQRVICSFTLNTPGNSWSDGSEWSWRKGDPPFGFELQRPMTTADIGHATWQMKCRNYYIEPIHFEYDSGSIEIT